MVALAHNRELRRRLGLLTAALEGGAPEALADQLYLVMAGAYCCGDSLGADGPAAAARATAERLLNSHLA